ncbi:unnamed protein product [Rotaria sordida]|uniref:Uncharacterized protein n=1 Tax=Rotaria sordida TaxID=392033 RepID=A0A815QBL9_9BILA|nr:unnamed protein product [Rotaria sordida]CAF1460203.1 unnamed protein product [Rotaria sordida]
MLFDLQIAEYRSSTNTQSTAICLPGIDHQTFSNINELKNHVITRSNSYTFILLLDLNDQNSHVDLEDLRTQRHILAIFICINPRSNLIFHGDNVYPVVKELMAYKIKSSVVQFFEDGYNKLLALNQVAPALMFKEKAKFFKQQRFINGKINACHVLIIPLNTNDENLFDFQERLIHLCYDLCGDYEPRICTIYDYLSSNTSSNFYENPYADILCNYVKNLSPIRVYLIGNETFIPNSVSKYFFENESNDDTADEYGTKPTFIENEPISEFIRQNLANILNSTRSLTNGIIQRLNEIANDIRFPAALERANVTIQGREMVADIQLQQQAIARSESPIEFSASFHLITQAQYGTMECNDNVSDGDINNAIQSESRRFLS